MVVSTEVSEMHMQLMFELKQTHKGSIYMSKVTEHFLIRRFYCI